MRIGQGFDAHRLVPGRPLILGGVAIPHDRGLEGHSDGDVLLHAVASALLGAMGDGDLGRHFPSTDASLSGIDSREIVGRVVARMREAGFAIGNVDATIVAQEPRLAGWLDEIRKALAQGLGAELDRVNVKVTSTDGLGAIGRGEGIACTVVCALREAADAP